MVLFYFKCSRMLIVPLFLDMPKKKQPFIHLNLFDSIFNYAYTENNNLWCKKMLPLTKSSLKSNTHQNVYTYEIFC